jgi:hypothetical protein
MSNIVILDVSYRLGAQFFITLGSELSSLDGEHCVFGEVMEGEDVLLKLNETISDESHRPYQDIRYILCKFTYFMWNMTSIVLKGELYTQTYLKSGK